MSERIGCGYCFDTIEDAQAAFICRECGTHYHRDCREQLEACPVCDETAFDATTVGDAPPVAVVQRRPQVHPSLVAHQRKVRRRVVAASLTTSLGLILAVVVSGFLVINRIQEEQRLANMQSTRVALDTFATATRGVQQTVTQQARATQNAQATQDAQATAQAQSTLDSLVTQNAQSTARAQAALDRNATQQAQALAIERARVISIYQEARFNSAFEDGVARLTSLIEREPENSSAYAARARLHNLMYQTEAAEDDVAVALALNADNPDVYVARASVRRSNGNLEGALDDAFRAVELDEECLHCQLTKCFMLLVDGQYTSARDTCDRAQDLDPDSPDAYINLAYLSSLTDAPVQARRYADQAIALAPGYERSYSVYAFVEAREENYEEALVWALQAVERNSFAASTAANAGFYYGELGDNRNAIAMYELATSVDTTNGSYWNSLGYYHDQVDEPGLAYIAYQQAIAVEPDLQWPYLNIGIYYQNQDNTRRAVQYYCDYLERSDEPREVVETFVDDNGGC